MNKQKALEKRRVLSRSFRGGRFEPVEFTCRACSCRAHHCDVNRLRVGCEEAGWEHVGGDDRMVEALDERDGEGYDEDE